jgi:large subunit ribosomal protein L25
VSFHAVKANEHVVTEVSIVLTGTNESEAVKAGLVVLQAIETVEVKAKPADLPSELTLDATQLAKEGDKLTLGDIILPAGVEFADVDENLGLVVANVYEPAALEAANEAASGAATDTVPPEAAEAASGESASKASTDGEASK